MVKVATVGLGEGLGLGVTLGLAVGLGDGAGFPSTTGGASLIETVRAPLRTTTVRFCLADSLPATA
jgi:hypothetical protein